MEQIISRKEAKAAGLARYYTGRACKHGHIAERYTCHSHCCECDRLDRAIYRAGRREKLKLVNKKYRAANAEKLRLKNKNYRETHKEQIAIKQKLYKQLKRNKKSLLSTISRKQARVVPAPDWNTMVSNNPNAIQRRGEALRDHYRAKRYTFNH